MNGKQTGWTISWALILMAFIIGIAIGAGFGYGKGVIDMASEGLKALEYVDNINIDFNETEIAQEIHRIFEESINESKLSLDTEEDNKTGGFV